MNLGVTRLPLGPKGSPLRTLGKIVSILSLLLPCSAEGQEWIYTQSLPGEAGSATTDLLLLGAVDERTNTISTREEGRWSEPESICLATRADGTCIRIGIISPDGSLAVRRHPLNQLSHSHAIIFRRQSAKSFTEEDRFILRSPVEVGESPVFAAKPNLVAAFQPPSPQKENPDKVLWPGRVSVAVHEGGRWLPPVQTEVAKAVPRMPAQIFLGDRQVLLLYSTSAQDYADVFEFGGGSLRLVQTLLAPGGRLVTGPDAAEITPDELVLLYSDEFSCGALIYERANTVWKLFQTLRPFQITCPRSVEILEGELVLGFPSEPSGAEGETVKEVGMALAIPRSPTGYDILAAISIDPPLIAPGLRFAQRVRDLGSQQLAFDGREAVAGTRKSFTYIYEAQAFPKGSLERAAVPTQVVDLPMPRLVSPKERGVLPPFYGAAWFIWEEVPGATRYNFWARTPEKKCCDKCFKFRAGLRVELKAMDVCGGGQCYTEVGKHIRHLRCDGNAFWIDLEISAGNEAGFGPALTTQYRAQEK